LKEVTTGGAAEGKYFFLMGSKRRSLSVRFVGNRCGDAYPMCSLG
jgi:hypothetical protein